MRALPLSIGLVHFVGIGGIGMSGIAEVLHTLGYAVQGSDIAESANVLRLRAAGIKVAVGHDEANLGAARVVVVSTAVKADNPEVRAARARLIPVVRRAEMLGELMRLRWSIAVGGTHGKTTTTSLVAAVLETAHLDPTVINGGIINAYGSNTRMGGGEIKHCAVLYVYAIVCCLHDKESGGFLCYPDLIRQLRFKALSLDDSTGIDHDAEIGPTALFVDPIDRGVRTLVEVRRGRRGEMAPGREPHHPQTLWVDFPLLGMRPDKADRPLRIL